MVKLNSLKVERVLREKGIFIFSPLEFRMLFGVSFSSAKNFINRHISTGLFIKIKNGLYVFAESKPPKFILGNRVYQPSYISFETALSYYHIIPETIYTIFSATTKSSREFVALDTSYVYHRVKKNLFFGYSPQKMGGFTFLMAEPEKALADYLYFVDLKKKSLNDRLDLRSLNKKALTKLIKLYERKGLVNLLNKIYDRS